MNMKIPASFKLGVIEYKVYLVEKIEFVQNDFDTLVGKIGNAKAKKLKQSSILFGLCDPSAQTIWLATKDIQGNDLSKERIVSTFYHELAHALVGETAYNEANGDEIFIEALGKNLYNYVISVSDEEAEVYVDEDEELESKTTKKKSKK